MGKQQVTMNQAPTPSGPYSQAVVQATTSFFPAKLRSWQTDRRSREGSAPRFVRYSPTSPPSPRLPAGRSTTPFASACSLTTWPTSTR